MHFTIFYQVTMVCTLLTKWIEIDNTSLEAVTLIEESDNEVLKLLKCEYIVL